MPELRRLYSVVDARDKILEAALAEFAEHGLHGATMRGIAGRADVSAALIHHHFRNKDALWDTVGERITAEFLDYVDKASKAAGPDGDSVPAMLRVYMTYWKEHPGAFRFNLWRLLEGPEPERRARSRATTSRTVPAFVRAQKAGLIRADMPAGLAMIVTGSLVQFWLHSQIEIRDALAAGGHGALTDEQFLAHVLALVQPPSRRRRK